MFEKIKEKWSERIQRNAIKSTLTHANKRGIKLMKEGVEVKDLPLKAKVTESVFFKRSLLPLGDWTRIYPPLSEDGRRIKIFNLVFGGWRNMIRLIVILAIIGLALVQFYDNFTLIDSLTQQLETCDIKLP